MQHRLFTFLFIVAAILICPACVLAGPLYAIQFRATTSASYGALQFRVSYGSAPGQFVGVGQNAACTANATLNAVSAFSNDVGPNQLNSGFIKSPQMGFPAVVATCTFESTGSTPRSEE